MEGQSQSPLPRAVGRRTLWYLTRQLHLQRNQTLESTFSLLAVTLVLLALVSLVFLLPLTVRSRAARENKQKMNIVMESFQELAGEVRSLKEQLVLKERLAALGEVSAGIAHELRNPLGVIAGYARLLLKSLDDNDGRREIVEKMLKEVEEMNHVIEELLRFSKPETVAKTDIDLPTMVSSVVESLGPEAERVQVSLNDCEIVKGDEGLVRQAVKNLVQNALDAGEQVWVEAQRGVVSGKEGVVIKVRDNGRGIEEDDIAKIFMPFYTKKEKGLGIGLSLVQKVAMAHKGRVSVESVKGKGSIFRFFLPYN